MKWLLLIFVSTLVLADPSLRAFHDANLQFTANIYKELAHKNIDSVLACPIAVQIIFSLLHAGARGTTSEQLANGLSLPDNTKSIQNMIGKVTETLEKIHSNYYTLTLANKVYVQDDFKIKDEFKSMTVNIFKSEIENLDFKQKEKAVKRVNDWVRHKTNDTIRDIVKLEDFNDNLRVILVNTIWFQSSWITPFDSERTAKKNFQINNLEKVEVDMMSVKDHFEYYESAELNAKFLKMHYQANGMSMVVVLPNDVNGLPILENRISEILTNIKFQYNSVVVSIPKFEMDALIKLKPILKSLGIQVPFTPQSDFSGISESEDLYVSEAVQKNHIEVNEKGTIAASATAVFISADAAYIELEPPKTFIADHSFIYYIQSPAGVVFIGKYCGI